MRGVIYPEAKFDNEVKEYYIHIRLTNEFFYKCSFNEDLTKPLNQKIKEQFPLCNYECILNPPIVFDDDDAQMYASTNPEDKDKLTAKLRVYIKTVK